MMMFDKTKIVSPLINFRSDIKQADVIEYMIQEGEDITIEIADSKAIYLDILHTIAGQLSAKKFSASISSPSPLNEKNIAFVSPVWAAIPPGEYSVYNEIENAMGMEDTRVNTCTIEALRRSWYCVMNDANHLFLSMLQKGVDPLSAQNLLPLDTKTDFTIKCNLNMLRRIILSLINGQTKEGMRIGNMILSETKTVSPLLFSDINMKT